MSSKVVRSISMAYYLVTKRCFQRLVKVKGQVAVKRLGFVAAGEILYRLTIFLYNINIRP